jgi:hypothetical protein
MSLYEQHQVALKELDAAKRRCQQLNPALKGGATDVDTLHAFNRVTEEFDRCAAKCSELARRLTSE